MWKKGAILFTVSASGSLFSWKGKSPVGSCTTRRAFGSMVTVGPVSKVVSLSDGMGITSTGGLLASDVDEAGVAEGSS